MTGVVVLVGDVLAVSLVNLACLLHDSTGRVSFGSPLNLFWLGVVFSLRLRTGFFRLSVVATH